MIDAFLTTFAANCANKGIPLLPTWHKYIDGRQTRTGCELDFTFPDDLPAIALAVVEILLRIGTLAAVAFVIYGGFLYMTSQGEPDKAVSARKTIINAVIGLVISLLATGIVSFIGGQLL
jgi:hypothetical protein